MDTSFGFLFHIPHTYAIIIDHFRFKKIKKTNPALNPNFLLQECQSIDPRIGLVFRACLVFQWSPFQQVPRQGLLSEEWDC